MSERNKPHNGRDSDGNFRVKRVDLDDVQTDPDGPDIIRDDVRIGGAVADTGALAGERARPDSSRDHSHTGPVRNAPVPVTLLRHRPSATCDQSPLA
jgi:hypothetical protein